jgi:predicted ribosome quality control (RQC) complex YloA/Tae2 family protein
MAEARWAATDRRAIETRREHLLSLARAGLEKKRRTIAALEKDLARMGEAESLRQRGELLKTALHRLEEGASSVEVTDWSTGEARPLRIPLDPTRTPVENLQRLFDRYKKLARGAALIAPHLEAAWDAEQRLSSFLTSIQSAELDELVTLEHALSDFGLRAQAPPAQRKREHQRLPYRRFESLDGTELLVGRSARDNDALTFHVARGSDIFLHARDVPGSHVILRRKDRTEPSQEALLDAASLAAFASRARHDTVVDVLWTERKHVRKVKGGAPGLVQTAATRNIPIRIDNTRIERLYRTLDPHEREG